MSIYVNETRAFLKFYVDQGTPSPNSDRMVHGPYMFDLYLSFAEVPIFETPEMLMQLLGQVGVFLGRSRRSVEYRGQRHRVNVYQLKKHEKLLELVECAEAA